MSQSPELTNKKSLGGLCSACEKASDCTFPTASKQPVLQCEEFEGYPPSKSPNIEVDNIKPGSTYINDTEKVEESKYKGLCSNCNIREDCIFPKPQGGVWRCEEYE